MAHRGADLREMGAFDGVLPVDKPNGPTSHDIVAMIRRRFRIKKVGHGGTLDPQATGLLIVLLGRGTKLSDRFMQSDKTYEGFMQLGVATDSQDAQGTVIGEAEFGHVTREQLESEMAAFTGDVMQIPPMVSAVKKNGVPLYKLARKGKTVEREPRLIHVYEFQLLAFEPPRAGFRMRCSKGTYVRTVCADIGERLGCGAHLATLRRTRCGDMDVEQALPAATIRDMDRDELARHVMPVTAFV